MLAVQGGSQFILPQNFQGGTINLKSLQGLKMIPIQTQQTTQIQSNLSTYLAFICLNLAVVLNICSMVSISDPQISTTSQAIKPPNTATSDS